MQDRAVELDGPDPLCADNPYPRYKPGKYDVLCVAVKTYFDPRFRRWVCWLQCQILGEKDKVSAFLNMGSGEAPTANRGSEYWRVWVMATGEQPRRGRLPKRALVGKVFSVLVDDTVKRYDKREHSEAAKYSTIKEFLARIGP
jgi:hypothetical protein